MPLSPWNLDRAETARALRYADAVISRRHSHFADYVGRPDFPLTCHVLPLGRMRAGEDRLAMIGGRASELVPPEFGDLSPRFGRDGVEFFPSTERDEWKSRSVWLAWFRPGWAELHMQAEPVKAHGGVAWLVRETIPFLIRAAAEVLKVAPPMVVSIRVCDSGIVFDGDRLSGIVSTPSSVVLAGDLGDRWGNTADRLLNQIAQGYGRPAFECLPTAAPPA